MTSRPHPWEVVESRVIVTDEWVHLRADDCRDADGHSIAPYYVLEYGDWVSVLALNGDGQAVMVEEYRHGAGVIALGTIGGAVSSGEDPRDAAVRELLEETGHAAEEMVDLGITWANFANQTNRVHHFLARGCVRVAEPAPDASETIAVHLLPFDGLGDRLHQSYHQLTWYKARESLRR